MPSGTQRTGGVHRPLTHEPLQQSASAVHAPSFGTHGSEHTKAPVPSATQMPEQQSVPTVHVPPSSTHIPGGPQTPSVHMRLQHSPVAVHGDPSGAQPGVHTVRPAPSVPQKPSQQGPVPRPQTSPSARHTPPRRHRRDSSSQMPEQQWSEPPERHSSPPGLHSGASSTSQRPSTQLCEQQSEFIVHAVSSLVVMHASPPHTPP